MKSVFIVGEHPYSTTGNGNMLRAILNKIDFTKYDVTCFVANDPDSWEIPNRLPFKIINSQDLEVITHGSNERHIDPWGKQKLVDTIANTKLDILLMVGIDIWRYVETFTTLGQLRDQRRFKWGAIFPYDLQEVRRDWIKWISFHDFPCVYSQYGFDKLNGNVRNIRYFRPPMADVEMFGVAPNRAAIRRKLFAPVSSDTFIFAFIGANMIRKDPQKLIKAFSMLRKEDLSKRSVLYLHTDMVDTRGYNLAQYAIDCGLETGDILTRPRRYDRKGMAGVYNSIDCLVNCTIQEGLSWTPLEAMLCGTPVIASDTTSHTELIKDAGLLVPCESPAYVQVIGKMGPTYVDAKCCDANDIASAMRMVLTDDPLRIGMQAAGIARAKEWVDGSNDINALLDEMSRSELKFKKKVTRAILFKQHSAGGDVLMTTRCLKGLKERHPGLPLVYMTSPQFIGIIDGNKYIDAIMPWKDTIGEEYEVVYNPHGERILPGHWGKNSNSLLGDFYWKILMVEPDDFYVGMKKPDISLPNKNICVVHTTGGDAQFRTYKYMGDVCAGLKDHYFTVQVGGPRDYPASADLDLRGKLSYQETAWVMNQASIAVTIDSYVSHLAGALGIPQVCLFGSGNAYVCRPIQTKGELVCLVPDYVRNCPGLGPCSAAVRDCPHPCTGIHSPESILQTIQEIENGVGNEEGHYRVKYAQ